MPVMSAVFGAMTLLGGARSGAGPRVGPVRQARLGSGQGEGPRGAAECRARGGIAERRTGGQYGPGRSGVGLRSRRRSSLPPAQVLQRRLQLPVLEGAVPRGARRVPRPDDLRVALRSEE